MTSSCYRAVRLSISLASRVLLTTVPSPKHLFDPHKIRVHVYKIETFLL